MRGWDNPRYYELTGRHIRKIRDSFLSPFVVKWRLPTLPLSPSNIDTDFGGIRFNFYEYTEKAVSFDTAF